MENNQSELDLYSKIYDIDNLMRAWRKARKHKTKKAYVIEFEKDTRSEGIFTMLASQEVLKKDWNNKLNERWDNV